ncbi:hypothetical protein IFM51744_03721 [Aspergillus udagawae]|nr:hypothetical protein IFM51744_03721 [Aspergillus udagawae]
MLFSNLNRVALIIALATSALGSVNSEQAVSDINALQESVVKARESLEGWNGGLMGAIPIASRIQSVQSAAANARRSIDESNTFDGKDADAVVAAYDQLHPEILSTLNIAEQKAPGFKDAGVGFVARAMFNDLKTEKDKFQTSMQQKVPAESYQMAAPSIAELDTAFEKTNKALTA